MNGSERAPGERYPGEATLAAAHAVSSYRDLRAKGYWSSVAIASTIQVWAIVDISDTVLAAVVRAVLNADVEANRAFIERIRPLRLDDEVQP